MKLSRFYRGREQKVRPAKIGLVLAGGGARAAYQVGVLKGIAEFVPVGESNPFPIISGTSAGAINGAALAIYAPHFHGAVRRLCSVWENFHVSHVFRSDPAGMLQNGSLWMLAMLLGGLGKHNPQALLNRQPLYELLSKRLPCARIQKSIDDGFLEAFGVSCSGYSSGQSVTFFQGREEINPWQRVRRVGTRSVITTEHLMASSALPFIFRPEKIHREYYGDGSMRQMAPLSPALHMGAERLLVIGVRLDDRKQPERTVDATIPTVAQVAGHALNSIFLDSLDADLERLHRINKTVDLIPRRKGSETSLRRVESLVISPSRHLSEIAEEYAALLPRSVAYFFRGIGVYKKDGSDFLSYLLFEREYCQALIELGYHDAMAQRENIICFLNDKNYQTPAEEADDTDF